MLKLSLVLTLVVGSLSFATPPNPEMEKLLERYSADFRPAISDYLLIEHKSEWEKLLHYIPEGSQKAFKKFIEDLGKNIKEFQQGTTKKPFNAELFLGESEALRKFRGEELRVLFPELEKLRQEIEENHLRTLESIRTHKRIPEAVIEALESFSALQDFNRKFDGIKGSKRLHQAEQEIDKSLFGYYMKTKLENLLGSKEFCDAVQKASNGSCEDKGTKTPKLDSMFDRKHK